MTDDTYPPGDQGTDARPRDLLTALEDSVRRARERRNIAGSRPAFADRPDRHMPDSATEVAMWIAGLLDEYGTGNDVATEPVDAIEGGVQFGIRHRKSQIEFEVIVRERRY